MKSNKLIASIISNCLFIAFEIAGFVFAFGDLGFETLKFYTQLSNLFAFLVVSVYVVFEFRQLKNGLQIPKFIKTLKYVATCVLTMTFLIVLFVLAPFSGYSLGFLLFVSSMLFHHTLCPIIAIITFLFFENYDRFTRKENFYGLLPTIIYALVFLPLNILKLTVGPYFFLEVYSQPLYMSVVWGIVCLGTAYLIVWTLGLIKNKISKKTNKS